MSSTEASPAAGTFAPAKPTDLRGPCPLVNCLANHGYIARDGRQVHAAELRAALREHVGLSAAVAAVFSNPIMLEHHAKPKPGSGGGDADAPPAPRPSLFARVWGLLRNPWSLFAQFGMRRADQIDQSGRPYIGLDQLALPGVVEHDVSLTRRDHQQPEGNSVRQEDLIRDLLASSADGKTLSMQDLAGLRSRRIAKQREVNPGAEYGPDQHQIACAEISLVLDVFGDGKSVRCDYARAFFEEERLPVREGWQRRKWWTLGLVELFGTIGKVKKAIGFKG